MTNSYYSALKKLLAIDLKKGSNFRLLDRAVIDAWKSMPERQTLYMFIWGNALSGFTTVILLLLFIGAVFNARTGSNWHIYQENI